MQVSKHFLFKLILSVVDGDRVVEPVKAVSFSNSAWLLDVADVRSGLTWLSACHHHGLVDGTESINNNFAFYRLHWVNDDSDCARVQHFLGLLGLDISA